MCHDHKTTLEPDHHIEKNSRNGLRRGHPPVSRCRGGSGGGARPDVRQQLGVAQVPLVHFEEHDGQIVVLLVWGRPKLKSHARHQTNPSRKIQAQRVQRRLTRELILATQYCYSLLPLPAPFRSQPRERCWKK